MATASLPEHAISVTYTTRGAPEKVLKLHKSRPVPSPSSLKPGEALVAVHSVGLNAGMLLIIASFPHPTSQEWIPELDYAGTIVALGPPDTAAGGAQFKVGDQVLGFRLLPDMLKYNGVLTSHLVTTTKMLAHVPKVVSMQGASGLYSCGCTAIQAVEKAGLKKGDKVLITGGSGGLGTLLVQVAKAVVGESGKVVATCSGRNVELVRGLGADEVIDYTVHDPLHEFLAVHHSDTKFNVIFDTICPSKELYSASPAYLTEKGTFLLLGGLGVLKSASMWSLLYWVFGSVMNAFFPTWLGGTPRRFMVFSAKPDYECVMKFLKLVEAGQVKPVVDSTWNVEDYKKAYEIQVSQRARGKVVVEFPQ